jgi:hypothetical protein
MANGGKNANEKDCHVHEFLVTLTAHCINAHKSESQFEEGERKKEL